MDTLSIRKISKGFGFILLAVLLAMTSISSVKAESAIAPITTPTDDFVIIVRTVYPGASSNTQFLIPTTGTGNNYNVDCDHDGSDEATGLAGNYTYTYAPTGTYTIRIKDNSGAGIGFPRIFFAGGGDKGKLLTIEQRGSGQWDSMIQAFSGCFN